MNMWKDAAITNAGVALLAKLAAGSTITITRAVIGSGAATNLKYQTAVTEPVQELTFRPVGHPATNTVSISCILRGETVTTGFTGRQIGIYAQDPDDGEILFYIMQSTTGVTVPSITEAVGYSAEWTFYMQISDEVDISITVDPSGSVSTEEMEQYVREYVAAHGYTLPVASKTLGGVRTTSNVTSADGLTPTPIISGVPYYADTTAAVSRHETQLGGLTFSVSDGGLIVSYEE